MDLDDNLNFCKENLKKNYLDFRKGPGQIVQVGVGDACMSFYLTSNITNGANCDLKKAFEPKKD